MSGKLSANEFTGSTHILHYYTRILVVENELCTPFTHALAHSFSRITGYLKKHHQTCNKRVTPAIKNIR